jgi:DUF1680 family protein
LLASLGQYIYSQSEIDLVVHLYAQGSGRFRLGDQEVTLRQETNYPWEETVVLQVEPSGPASFGLRVRIPGWCTAPEISINGAATAVQSEEGYARIEREWHAGDTLTLTLPMPIQTLHAHPDVAADAGQVTLRRGPLIYCLEAVDGTVPLQRVMIGDSAGIEPERETELLGGVTVLTGQAGALDVADWGEMLYRTAPPAEQPYALRAVPYYAWDNREPGPMRVWLLAAPDGRSQS